ncbi:hypothetical protein BDR26DRAFT_878038 [Obelidium mucronatum]|nr:hypothetical protein BDR26DRAFT_878038 [Obelidium mucronatum]
MPLAAALRDSFLGSDAARMAAFFAVFAAAWKAVNNSIVACRGKSDAVNSFTAGALAGGLACLMEQRQWRIDMAQQLCVRGLQALFNSLSINGHFSFRHGNSLIFAYVIWPNTIPDSYYKFILSTGPIPEDILVIFRQQLRGISIRCHQGDENRRALSEAVSIIDFPDCVPCGILHPPVDDCNTQMGLTLVKVLRAILPVYASLNFVPMVVLKTRELLRRPQALIFRGVKNTIRSSLFLAVFVSTFMRIACITRTLIQRKIISKDNRYLFWLNGLISSAAIFIEDEKRRSELAMYVLPRGMDALYRTLYSKSLIFRVPHFEVGMFSVATGLIIMYYQTEPEALGGIIYRLLRRIDLTIEDAMIEGGGANAGPDDNEVLEKSDPRDRSGSI